MAIDVSKLPFSPIRTATGTLFFLSGQVGTKEGNLVSGFEGQLRQTFANIRAVLEERNLTLGKVVEVTVFLTSMGDYSVFNKIYAEEFAASGVTIFPARTCVAVAELPLGARVELKVVASTTDTPTF